MFKNIAGLYKHYSGKTYQVIGIAKHANNPSNEFVVYRQLYKSVVRETNEELPYGTMWIRPKDHFFNNVNINEKTMERFTKITDTR